jgi:hypothetical protein
MNVFNTLLDIACGRPIKDEENVRARRMQLIVAAMLLSLVFAGIWGLAAGSSTVALAMSNLYKVPMVVLLSTVAAIPAGMLCWKLTGGDSEASDLLTGFTTGIFAGTLVMAAVSPLVALYYHSSSFAGPILALGSVATALGVGTLVFLRSVFAGPSKGRSGLVFPVLVFIGMQMATMLQLIALAAPILPEDTLLDGGIDRIVRSADESF